MASALMRINAAYSALRAAKMGLHAVVEEVFCRGTPVEWYTSRNGVDYRQRGKVVLVGHDDSVKVENQRTGKKHWISACDLRQWLSPVEDL